MRKQQLVRDAIWDAAIQLFAEKGFDETTVDDIAAAAGTSRRSFFRYFQSKSDLMAQDIANYGASLTDAVRSCPAACPLPEVLKRTVLQTARHSAGLPRTRQIMEIAAKYPAARAAQMARIAEVQDHLAQAFAERCRAEGGDELAARVLAGLTLSLLSVTFRSWYADGDGDIAATVERVMKTVQDLVGGRAGGARRSVAR